MQKTFASHVVWLMGLTLLSTARAQDIRVMQWNVHGHIGHTASNTTAGAKALARIVNYNQPDVLLFNELDDNGTITTKNALIDWATNNVPYLGSPNVGFYVSIATLGDGFERNGAITRFPVSNDTTYNDGLRGLHAFKLQFNSLNALQVFHAHLKCCGSFTSSECSQRQSEAQFDSDTIRTWAGANSLPYIFAGDWNEDETNPQCTLSSTYRPITMIRTNGNLVQFIPTALDGDKDTISSSNPTRRFDYCLAASNRLSAVSGYVFNAAVWGSTYTSANPSNTTSDSTSASDHLCVFVNYSFPLDIGVSPTNVFASLGIQGGPFSPPSQVYTLTNSGTVTANWRVTKGAAWLTISATNGTLAAGATSNIAVSINATANSLTPSNYTDTINFSNTVSAISVARSVNLTVLWPPPVANFSASPTNGVEPLLVTFTDTSMGNITNRFWDFGESNTSNTTATTVTHSFTGGTYSVRLIVNGPGGAGTNTQSINVLTVFQNWQIQYFGSTTNPAGAANADADGDGQNNMAEFLSNTDPTNNASGLRILSIMTQGQTAIVTWASAGGTTNFVEGGVGDIDGNSTSYSNLFYDMSGPIIVPGTGNVVTNFIDDGTWWDFYSNWPVHYYRVRVQP